MKRIAIVVFGIFASGPVFAETNLHYYAQEGDKAEQSRVVLDAHRELMALNEQNAAQFRTVVEFLEKEGTGGGEG